LSDVPPLFDVPSPPNAFSQFDSICQFTLVAPQAQIQTDPRDCMAATVAKPNAASVAVQKSASFLPQPRHAEF
jgi:hypothetical protein